MSHETHSSLIQTLSSMVGTGEVIEVIYLGGSKPGTMREIVPMEIIGDKLIALDLSSQKMKTYFINKIVYPTALYSQDLMSQTFDNIIHFESIDNVVEYYNDFFLSLELTPRIENARLDIHEKFKNGKLKKTPIISLWYEEYASEQIYDFESEEFVEREYARKKPWILLPKGTRSRSYNTLDNAVKALIGLLEQEVGNGTPSLDNFNSTAKAYTHAHHKEKSTSKTNSSSSPTKNLSSKSKTIVSTNKESTSIDDSIPNKNLTKQLIPIPSNTIPFYFKNWFVNLFLFLFYPIGITLTLVNPHFSKRRKYITIIIFAILIALIFLLPNHQK